MAKWKEVKLRLSPSEHAALEQYAAKQSLSMNFAGREWVRSLPEYKAIRAKIDLVRGQQS